MSQFNPRVLLVLLFILIAALLALPRSAPPALDVQEPLEFEKVAPSACCKVLSMREAEPPTAELRDTAPVFETFSKWAMLYQTSSPKEREVLIERGIQLAKERRPEMLALIQTDPESALRQALPRTVQRELPAAVQALLEEQISAEGVLRTAIATPLDRSEAPHSQRHMEILGRTLQAHTYGRRSDPAFDRKTIPVHGIVLDSQIAVSDSPLRRVEPGEVAAAVLERARKNEKCPVSGVALAAASDAIALWAGSRMVFVCQGGHIVAAENALIEQETAATPDVAESGWTEGNKTVLYMRAKFRDQTGDPQGTDMAKVAKFMRENSYGKTDFITTYVSVTLSNDAATYSDWTQVLGEARNIAKSKGQDYTKFNLDCVYYTGGPGGFAGVAYVGGRGAALKYDSPSVAAHEFGHNLGLLHANFWDTTDGTSIGAGSNQEYGNGFDVMGDSWDIEAGHYNAYEKNVLNWVPSSNVSTGDAGGTFRIFAHDLSVLRAANMYAVKVNKDGDRVYWLDYRQHPNFSGNPWIVNGVSVHWDKWAQTNGSHLLDIHPATSDKGDCPLTIGETFSDLEANLHFTVVARGGTLPDNWIDVTVKKGPFPDNHAPVLTLSVSPQQIYVYQSVALTAVATDADGDALAYHWDLGNNTFGPNAATVPQTWNTPGTRTIACTVTDMKGGTHTKTVTVNVLPPPPDNGIGLQAEYFDNSDLTNLKLTRIDPTVNFDFGTGAPAPGIGADTFSVRWSGLVLPQYTQSYTFYVRTDDGVRLWVNDKLLVDQWVDQGATERSGKIDLVRGTKVRIVMEYYDAGGGAVAQLSWSSASVAKAIIPKSQLFPPNKAPVLTSNVAAAPNPATTVDTVAFAVTASDADGDLLTYAWVFGDGASGTGASASHNYSVPGTYTAQVTVSDGRGGAVSGSVNVVVTPPPNRAPELTSSVVAAPNPATTSDTVAFTAAAIDADGDPLTYAWIFGDGTSGTGASASHNYSAPGTYTAQVTVSDGQGGSVSGSVSVVVTSLPNGVVRINFQPAGAAVPNGYLPDSGVSFGDRGNGFSYGWNRNISADTRDRNASNSPDQRYDTLIHLQKASAATWEFALSNGSYTVRVVCGDPSYFDSIYKVDVEGVSVVNGTPSATQKWFEGTQPVTVNDGRLTIGCSAGAQNNKICFVEIHENGVEASTGPSDEILAQNLIVTALQLKMNFAKPNRDGYKVSGTIPSLPTGFVPTGLNASVDVGAAILNAVLDSKGRGKTRVGSLQLKRGKSGWQLRASAKNIACGEAWGDGGLTDTTVTTMPVEVPVTVRLGDTSYAGSKTVTYSAKRKKSGQAR